MIIFKIKVKKFNIITKHDSLFMGTYNNSCRDRIKPRTILHNLFNFGFFVRIGKDYFLKVQYQKLGFRLKDFLYYNNIMQHNVEGYIKIK